MFVNSDGEPECLCGYIDYGRMDKSSPRLEARTPNKYTKEFKQKAVALVSELHSAKIAAEQLSVKHGTLQKWVRAERGKAA